ncbi:MAG: hypothetical protein P4L84_28470 [Isosphaeraceae bacterium]|nr:hypothetical protein [Isosphaeraceae bacterium]
MSVSFRVMLGALMVLAAAGPQAHAQFGYGYYPGGYGGWGWGGWGGGVGTVQGDIARGLGYYAAGAGQYNLDTAMANAINADTVGRWNEFMFLSQMEANRRERERLDRRMRRDAGASEAIAKRVRENPTPDDIVSGDALNAALDQITDPRIHASALRMAKTPISGQIVRAIPFVNASDAVTICMDQLSSKDGWPGWLRRETFAAERAAYESAVDKALKEDAEGDVSPATIAEVRAAASRVRAKLQQFPPADREQLVESQNYVKTLLGLARMLERPGVDKILAELDKIDKTTIGSLLGFMHTFNLRFGRASTPRQRAAYEAIYPLLDAERDKLVQETDLAARTVVKAKKREATDFFQGMHLDHLEGKTRTSGDASK